MQSWTVYLTISRVQFCTAQQTTKTARGGARAPPSPSPRFIVCWVPPPSHTHTEKHSGQGKARGMERRERGRGSGSVVQRLCSRVLP